MKSNVQVVILDQKEFDNANSLIVNGFGDGYGNGDGDCCGRG